MGDEPISNNNNNTNLFNSSYHYILYIHFREQTKKNYNEQANQELPKRQTWLQCRIVGSIRFL